MRRKLFFAGVALSAILLVAFALGRGGPKLPADLPGALEAATLQYGLPGMAACIVTVDDIETAAYGSRALDASFGVHGRGALDHVTVEDHWHIGSNTKAITATLVGILYEEGKLGLDDKLSSAFKYPLQTSFADVTLRDLLQHRSGIAEFTAGEEWTQLGLKEEGSPREQRAAFAKEMLTRSPKYKRGEFHYSNAGYGIAAAFIEARTGKSWEELLEQKIFAPLDMRVRFGWPATNDDPQQPLGHVDEGRGLRELKVEDPYALPAALDPAGDLSMPIGDYAKFLQLHLRGLRGLMTEAGTGNSKHLLLLPATIELLHTATTGDYACGWIETKFLGLKESNHDGSAGTFYLTATIDANNDVAVAVVTNAGNTNAEKAVHTVARRMLDVVARERSVSQAK